MSEQLTTVSMLHTHMFYENNGGAQRYAANIADHLYQRNQLGYAVTTGEAPDVDPSTLLSIPRERVIHLPKPAASTPDLLNNPEHREKLLLATERGLEPIRGRTIARLFAQYYAAGAVALEAKRRNKGLKVAMTPHTLERSVNTVGVGSWEEILANPRETRRSIYEGRDQEELAILNEADAIIVGTAAEMSIIPTLYPEIDPDLLQGKLHYAHLGVSDEFLDTGALEPKERDFSRMAAKGEILHILQNRVTEQSNLGNTGKAAFYEEQYKRLASLSHDTFMFYWLGRIDDGKGFEFAADAFIGMMTQERGQMNSAMLFAGGPFDEQKSQIQYLYRRLEEIRDPSLRAAIESKMIFTDIIPGYLAAKAGDAGVFNSDAESFSLVLLEALAAGNNAIATNYPTIREVSANGQYAQLIDPRNPMEIARAMSNSYLQDKWQIYEANRAYGRQFTWQRTGERLTRILSSL